MMNTTIVPQQINAWLSKYLIKYRDPNTILLYPKDGNTTLIAPFVKSQTQVI